MAKLGAAERALDVANRVVTHLPRSNRVRDLVSRVDRERDRLDFVRRYADLYGAYTEVEVIYTDDRTADLWDSLGEPDRRAFDFDPTRIDWRYYLQDVHFPAVTLALRFPAPPRPKPEVRVVPRADGVLAVFDMEGTLLDSNVVESYVWLRMSELSRRDWTEEMASVLRRLLRYLSAERSIVVSADRPLPVQADGEIIGETPVRVQVAPAAVRVIVPAANVDSPRRAEADLVSV